MRKWFFLVNLQDCRIFPEAWAQYASRGKRVNLKSSLGSVRFDPSPETAQRILEHAETDQFDPNLCSSREAALERIAVLRHQGLAPAR